MLEMFEINKNLITLLPFSDRVATPRAFKHQPQGDFSHPVDNLHCHSLIGRLSPLLGQGQSVRKSKREVGAQRGVRSSGRGEWSWGGSQSIKAKVPFKNVLNHLYQFLRATIIVPHRSEQPKRTEPLKGKKGAINEPASMIGADG